MSEQHRAALEAELAALAGTDGREVRRRRAQIELMLSPMPPRVGAMIGGDL